MHSTRFGYAFALSASNTLESEALRLGKVDVRVEGLQVDLRTRQRHDAEVLNEAHQSNEQLSPCQSLARALPFANAERDRALHQLLFQCYPVVGQVPLGPEPLRVHKHRVRLHDLVRVAVDHRVGGYSEALIFCINGRSMEQDWVGCDNIGAPLHLVDYGARVRHRSLQSHRRYAILPDSRVDFGTQFFLRLWVRRHEQHRPSQRRRR
ncbi:hypothetical protein PFISCL1PPCAC_13862, partial [Pristionchus fissidentatus]